MRTTTILSLATVLLLAGCGDNAADEATTLAEAAEDMADGPQPQPGQYTTSTEILEFSVPGLSEDMQAMMRSAMAEGAQTGSSYCLTEADAATSREDMIRSMTESNCTVERFDMAGGDIDAALSCPAGEGGMTGDVTMTGTMSETGANMEVAFSSQVPEMGQANIRMRIVSERVGDCS